MSDEVSPQPEQVADTTESAEPVQRRSQRTRTKTQFLKNDPSEDASSRASKRRKVVSKDKPRSSPPKPKDVVPSFPNLEKDGSKNKRSGSLRVVNYSADFLPGSNSSSARSSRKSTPKEQPPSMITALKATTDVPKRGRGRPRRQTVDDDSPPAALTPASCEPKASDTTVNDKLRISGGKFQVEVATTAAPEVTISEPAIIVKDFAPSIKKDMLAPEVADRLQRPKPPPRVISDGQRTTRNSAPNALPLWADPKSPEFDVIRWLKAEEYHPQDPLLQKPTPNFTYADSSGRLKNAGKYAITPPPSQTPRTDHPKIAYHRKNGTLTPELFLYYKDLPRDRVLPLAGIAPPDTRAQSTRSSTTPDKSTDVAEVKTKPFMAPMFPGSVKRKEEPTVLHSIEEESDTSSSADFAWHHVGLRDEDELTGLEQEENFFARPTVKIPIPDHIKAILVDDWENVTKSQLLVPLPAEKPVEMILDDYLANERPRRIEGTNSMDILEEVIAGLREYFERCLGRILLYRLVNVVD